MEIKVRIIQVNNKREGVSKAGNAYSTQEFIGETFEDQYPRKICFLVMNGKVDIPSVGSDVIVSFDLESRSYMGKDNVERWSTDVKPFKIESATAFGTAAPAPQQPVQPQPTPQPQVPPVQMGNLSQQEMDAAAAAFFGQQQPYAAPQPSNDLPF